MGNGDRSMGTGEPLGVRRVGTGAQHGDVSVRTGAWGQECEDEAWGQGMRTGAWGEEHEDGSMGTVVWGGQHRDSITVIAGFICSNTKEFTKIQQHATHPAYENSVIMMLQT